MIAYSIDCALQSGLLEQVIVSTDDEESRGRHAISVRRCRSYGRPTSLMTTPA